MTTNHNNSSVNDPDVLQKQGEETVKGIEKRVGAKGDISYRVKIRLKGYPVVSKTFKTNTHAKKWKKQTEVQIEQGHYFNHVEGKKYTLQVAIDKYFDVILPTKPKNAVNTKRHLQWWSKKLGPCFLHSIKPSMIAELRDELLEGLTSKKTKRSPATVVRYLASLSHLMTIAEREWEWIESNPVKKVSKPQESRGRTRYLNQAEIKALFQLCKNSRSKELYPVVVLALATGMRRSEVLWLRWKQINLEQGIILLEQTKNNEPRIIPLQGFTLELLQAKKEESDQPEDLLFPSPHNLNAPIDMRSAWRHALKESGIANFRFHDLRHSCASLLAMNGYSLLDIAKLLGHKDLQSTQRYSHLSHEYTKQMVTNINQQLFENE